MAKQTRTRQPGRPRRAQTDDAILRAAADLIAEAGLQGTTISEVARRAGVARASVYLRWPSRDALVGAATKATLGGEPFPITGDVAGDLAVGAQYTRRLVGASTFKPMFPQLAAAVLADLPEIEWDTLSPNRPRLAELYRRVAAEQGLDPDIDPEVPYHLIVGPLFSYLLANGRAPSEAWTADLVRVVLRGLRAP